MITLDIIARFNLQVDDSSELSSDEELALAQEVYNEVCEDRPWEFLKTSFEGTSSTTVPYIDLPADFRELAPNKDGYSVVFVGTDYAEYKVVPFSSRREHRDQDGFCYIDIASSRLYFTKQPTIAKSVEYDYIKIPPALTPTTAPLVTTSQFGNMIAYGMAGKFNPIEQSEKATSYQRENRAEYFSMLSDFRMLDANIKLAM